MVVIGAAGIDMVGYPLAELQERTSNPSRLTSSHGGVARNVAENLARLGLETNYIGAVGDDRAGRRIMRRLDEVGVGTEACLRVPDNRTGSYFALLDHRGGLYLALDDMEVVSYITADHIVQWRPMIEEAILVFVDANLGTDVLATVTQIAQESNVPLAADPTSRALAGRLKPHLNALSLVTPNEGEADVLCPDPVEIADSERAMRAARHIASEGVETVIITMAEFGVAYATATKKGHIPALRTEVLDPTGAGDALTATVIFGMLNDIPLDESVRLGVSAAALTLRTPGSVHPELSLELLYDQLI